MSNSSSSSQQRIQQRLQFIPTNPIERISSRCRRDSRSINQNKQQTNHQLQQNSQQIRFEEKWFHKSQQNSLALALSLLIMLIYTPAVYSTTQNLFDTSSSSAAVEEVATAAAAAAATATAAAFNRSSFSFTADNKIHHARVRRSPDLSVSPLYSGLPSTRSGSSSAFLSRQARSSSSHMMNNVNHHHEMNFVDNHKPAFKNCANYAPVVKEEKPEKTFVIRVHAEDPDPDQEITYSLIQSAAERPKFNIVPNTGVIVTAHTFDRDEPIQEKMIYVTVQATDNGHPPLEAVCTFKVTIEDINDNPPVFNKARYDESISEDKLPDAVVMRISANDLDDGYNSIVEYEILPERDFQYFRINKQAGYIYLNRAVDKRPGQYYTITVRAYNIVPDAPQDAQIEVRIRVVESSKKPPSFIDPIEEPIHLKEDYADYSTPIVTLHAMSNVPDKPEVIFELITGRTEQTNSKKTFVFKQKGNKVALSLRKPLDYESITEYTLTMSVRNTYDLSAEHVIKIKVEDVNDNIPYFTEVKTGTILENEPPGTPVMQVRAFDMDGTEANNIVTFELADNREFFAIDSHSGNITALKTFDREARDFYNVKVIASDNSPSILYQNGKPNRGQQLFHIEIADKNDHKPNFTKQHYFVQDLHEDANINHDVIEVTAEDKDNASQLKYTIESGNVGEAFKINEETGVITVNQRLDYENITEYVLKIRAFDGFYEDSALVTIQIADVNDNPPVATAAASKIHHARVRRSPDISVSELYSGLPSTRSGSSAVFFSRQASSSSSHMMNNVNHHHEMYFADNHKPAFKNCANYAPVVKEENPENTFVIRVTAEDPDPDQEITYSLIQSAAERPKFNIVPNTGVIVTAHTFDRDEPIQEKMIYVTVQATDNGHPPLEAVCTFKVTIEDINDNPPVFNKARYDESISEDKLPDAVVMRISANDLDDGYNSIVEYEILPERDFQYFRINKQAGYIYLNRAVDKRPGQYYTITVRAYNIVPDAPQDAQIEVRIRVVESSKKPPSFIDPIEEPIHLKEDYADYSTPIVTLHAMSNVPDKPEVIFELITGRTEQTNSKKTFLFKQKGNKVALSLRKQLDYESITEYTLTMSVRNTYDLSAEHVIKIKVEDVNDNIPYFTEVKTGTILENEPTGTPVMQVRAFDMDGTEANNIVTFELADNREFFAIDSHSGNITALKTFDRETRDFYNVKVIASDNSPSSLYQNGEPNRGQQVFYIEIADKNDHKPNFTKPHYFVKDLHEDANINHDVIEVTAEDVDNASQIKYTIKSGNVGEAFKINEQTGLITVNQRLDYENITEYVLKIRAFDGLYEDYALVTIQIANVNDNPPKFLKEKYSTTIQEEKVYDDCILQIEAHDPDIKDPNAPQHIKYFVVKQEQKKYLSIDKNGCLKLIQPLDRDPPNGHKSWDVIISAVDEDEKGISSVTQVTIHLQDINDNAPFLINKMPVIWQENRNTGQIVRLEWNDYDEPQNGPPYTYGIDGDASADIKRKFSINNDYLFANVEFDREEQKEYFIPIRISDSGQPKQNSVSILHLIIGDVNDNAMSEGSSRIFIYNFRGEAPDTEVGRVFVDDSDDWDLEDKEFQWKNGKSNPHFRLNTSTGMITMIEGIPEGKYTLEFVVTEESTLITRHTVDAEVMIVVRQLPDEAVDKSGSIRFYNITKENFISVPRDAQADDSLSLKDQLQYALAKLFNTSVSNVDVFTVLENANHTLDVRFAAHGSPYYEPAKLNGIVGQHQQMLEAQLDVQMLMVNIDECLIEHNKCESSCTNALQKSTVPYMIYSNTTSFVGVNAFVEARCVCEATTKARNYCLNGGTPRIGEYDICDCIEGFTGPHCELVSVGFYGNGYAFYEPIAPCDNVRISLEIAPQTEQGLIMYMGPLNFNSLLPISDFLALELVKGYPVLTVDYGSGTTRIEHRHIQLQNGISYQLDISLQKSSIEMTVDNCRLSTCMSLGAPQGPNEFLNVNAPLQLGGTPTDLTQLGNQLKWTFVPGMQGFFGCVRNLVINNHTYNLGAPALSRNIDSGCQRAVSFGIDCNFPIAIISCIVLLLIIFLAVVVQKKQKNGWLVQWRSEGGKRGNGPERHC